MAPTSVDELNLVPHGPEPVAQPVQPPPTGTETPRCTTLRRRNLRMVTTSTTTPTGKPPLLLSADCRRADVSGALSFCSVLSQSPLHPFSSAQPGPGALDSCALAFTLCRRVGHSTAPMASDHPRVRAERVHSDRKADQDAVSQRTRQKCSVTPAGWSGNHAGMEEQDLLALLELQRLTRELLDHLNAMLPVEEGADLLRCAMADGPESYAHGPECADN